MTAKTSRMRSIAGWGAVGLALLAGLVWQLRPAAVPVDLGTVARGRLEVTLDQEGRTRVRHRYVVSAPVAGRLLRIALEPGDGVEAARTEVAVLLPDAPPLLDARSRAAAEARVGQAGAWVAQARARLAEAETAAALAAKDAARLAELLAADAVSQREVDAARAGARAREQAVDAARAGVVAAQRELDAAEAALADAAPAGRPPAGRGVTVRAPIHGVVLRRFHESAAVVRAGEPLVEVADVADLEIVADYLTTDAVRIRPGMRARVDRWGGGSALDAAVRRVEPSGFVKVSALGVEEQRVNVILDFADPRDAWRALGDGYRVEVRVIEWTEPDALIVPESALFRDGRDWAAYVVTNGRARRQAVDVGRRSGLDAEVRGGLSAGDAVVLHPSDRVADGVWVAARR